MPARRTGSTSAAAAAAAGVVRTAAPELELRMGWHDVAARALARSDLRCRFDPSRRAWALPLAQHDAVIEALAAAPGVRVRVEPLPPLAAAVLRAAAAIPDDSSRYAHVPVALEEQLMPFQREGVRFALSRGGRALIGDEMGLGKTVQALAVAACYRDEWPVLVVAPSSLREAWADAVHKWLALPEERVRVVHTGKDAAAAGAAPPGAHDFLIVSYNFLDKMELAGGRYRVVVVDESHYIKDGAAKRTKAAMPVLKEARRCLLLTGTPALNRPKEVFTQLAALLPAAKLRMPAFGERYCAGNRFDRYGGAANLEELHALLTGSVMVRRLKADVLAQLPQKRRQQVFLSLDAEGKRELAALQAQMGAVKAALAQLHAQAFASAGAAGGGAGRMEENRALMEVRERSLGLCRLHLFMPPLPLVLSTRSPRPALHPHLRRRTAAPRSSSAARSPTTSTRCSRAARRSSSSRTTRASSTPSSARSTSGAPSTSASTARRPPPRAAASSRPSRATSSTAPRCCPSARPASASRSPPPRPSSSPR